MQEVSHQNYAYNLTALLRPGATQENLDYVTGLVAQAIEEHGAQVYNTEHRTRELSYKVAGNMSATIVVVSWMGPKATANAVRSKVRYREQILRAEVFRDKAKYETSRLDEAPLTDSMSLHCLNPRLEECVGETGKILPRKFTKLKPKLQRKLSRAIKAARSFGLMARKYTTVTAA
jgi:ribosomal protein S6